MSRQSQRTRSFAILAAASVLGSLAPAAFAQAPSPVELVDALEGVFGKQAGARRSGAKGVCATGFFVGTAEGRALTGSSLFSGQEIPAVIRFSVGGGSPKATDKGKTVRGLAVRVTNGKETWETSNISAPVFFVSKPEHFVKFLEARRPDPATGRPDAAKVKAYNDSHPDSKPQIEYLAKAPVPASYGAVNYWGTNAFEFSPPGGKKVYGKWMFEASRGTIGLNDDELKSLSDNFLNDELRKRVASLGVGFDFKVQLAEPGDKVDDPTVPLPANRKVVTAGRLVVEKVESGAGGACDKITFNPLVLPKGVGPSPDPVLMARPGSYSVSLSRRLPDQK